jgi:hypothetical protein
MVFALVAAACSPSDPGGTTSVPATSHSTRPPPSSTPISTTTTVGSGVTTTTTVGRFDVALEGEAGDLRVKGPDVFTVVVDDQVEITVLSPVAGIIHVHGYDHFFEVEPGVATLLTFVADVPGIFEVELEDKHLRLFDLEVTPS